MQCCTHRSDTSGFTLVEVLVALLVLALALVALQLRMSSYLNDAAYLRDRTLAQWVALNQVELLHIARRLDLPAAKEASAGSVRFAGQQWYWQLQAEGSTVPDASDVARLLRMQVSPLDAEAARNNPLVSLVTVQEPAREP